ncbi:MAG: glycosyltransferase family 4 protein [Bacteroidota bacterium]
MSNPLNILIHAPDLQTIGGKQSYFLAVKDAFRHNVTFFTYGKRGRKESKLYSFWRLFRDYWSFFRTLRKGNFDVVHLNPSLNNNSFFRDIFFMMICRLVGAKTLVFWHGWNWDFEAKKLPKVMWWFNMTYFKADGMIILAREFEEKLRSYGVTCPIYLETTVVDDYLVDDVSPPWIEQKFDHMEKVNLLFLARVVEDKGIFECIDAFARLKPQYPNLVLNICGTGDAFDAAQALIEELKLEDVHMLGFINGPDKTRIFHESTIYLFPSTYGEGLPCSVLESMGVGLPVITTDVGGIKDFFEPENMGAYVHRDAGELVMALKPLLDSPERIKEIGLYNYHYAKRRFSANQVASRIERIYEDMHQGQPGQVSAALQPEL